MGTEFKGASNRPRLIYNITNISDRPNNNFRDNIFLSW